jgi:ribosomal protein S18 acetylase RimI-like enzyme
MNNVDIYKQIAVLHRDSINNGFLGSLGINFLSFFYSAIDSSASSILIVKICDGKVVAFIAGTKDIDEVYKAILKRPFKLFSVLAPNFFSAKKLIGIFDIYFLNKNRKKYKDGLPLSELLSLAVHGNYRNQGYASELFFKLIDFFKNSNIRTFKILAGSSLTEANYFYKKNGARFKKNTILHGKYTSNVYIYKID